jgi:hypothetical protein
MVRLPLREGISPSRAGTRQAYVGGQSRPFSGLSAASLVAWQVLRPRLHGQRACAITLPNGCGEQKNASHCGVLAMPDSLYHRFFLEPQQPLHRRYEALRAVFVDHQPQGEVAKRLGSTSNTVRRFVSDLRAPWRAAQVPPLA